MISKTCMVLFCIGKYSLSFVGFSCFCFVHFVCCFFVQRGCVDILFQTVFGF